MTVISFTLHHYETNEPINISFVNQSKNSNLGPTYTCSSIESNIEIRWKDENDEFHHAKVRETMGEIEEKFNEVLKKSKGLSNHNDNC